MTDKKNNNTFSRLRYEKLIGFTNWLLWSDFTKAMLIEKDVWDFVETGPKPN